MLSPHIWLAFQALIPPCFTSLNPFETFFRPLQNDPILAVTTGESMRIPGLTPSFPVIYRKCCHDAKQAVHTKLSLL